VPRKRLAVASLSLYRVWTIETRELAAMTRAGALQNLQLDADLLGSLARASAMAAAEGTVATVIADWP
jgi:hypothetical protein